MIVEIELDDMRRGRERRVDRGGRRCANRSRDCPAPRAKSRARPGARGGGRGHRGQRRVIDRDLFGGVERLRAGLGDDQRDRLADIADLALGQQRLRRESEWLAGLHIGFGRRPQRLQPVGRASSAVSTASTPGRRAPLPVSIAPIRACACGERSTTACARPFEDEVVEIAAAAGR